MHEQYCWLWEPLNSKIVEENPEREEEMNCRQEEEDSLNLWVGKKGVWATKT